MKSVEMIETYASLLATDQARFLVRLSWELTLVGRGLYVPPTEEPADQRGLRTINELQHQISQHVRALLEDDSRRYPDDALMQILLGEAADHPVLRDGLNYALMRALQYVRPEMARLKADLSSSM